MKISIVQGDITKIKADAIVNAANSFMLGGRGVDGAIHRAAGNELLLECKKLRDERFPNGLPTGEAIATKAYNLNAKIIIHTVGPRYNRDRAGLLFGCYENSFNIAKENNCKTIAFPAIGCGAYGIPIEKSALVLRRMIKNVAEYDLEFLDEIIFVLFDEKSKKIYEEVINNPKDTMLDYALFCSGCLDPMSDVIDAREEWWFCYKCKERFGTKNNNKVNAKELKIGEKLGKHD